MSLSDQLWSPTSAQVTVLQARGLRIKGKNGTNDAYAVMQVGKEKYQTSVAEKSVAPIWKEEASFDMPSAHQGGTERGTLHVHVLHRALVGPDKLLGQAVIDLLQLSEDTSRDKTQWFKLFDKAGKPDKDRGEVLVDIQFMRNNMTASMFDISAAGKSRSRLGKLKDKVRGKKKEGLSETTSNVVPSFSQVLTDSEDECNSDGEGAAGKDEKKKKKNKVKSLFSHKSNLQKNLSQSMSVLPGKNSSLSGSMSSGLNVEASEGKKKFKFLSHKRSGSSDKKDQKLGAEQSNLCINGSHIYCEEPVPRTSRTSSNFSLTSSGVGSMEDVPDSSPPSVGSTRSVRHSSPWTEEEEEETIEETTLKVNEEMFRRQELEKLAEEESKLEEEEEQRRVEEEKKHEEDRRQREEEERLRMEDEQRRQEEEIKIERERLQKEDEAKRTAEMLRVEEERKQREEEEKRIQEEEKERRRTEEEEQRRREEEEKQEKEKIRQEEVRMRLEEEKQRQEEEERRHEEERRAIEKRRQEEKEEEMRKMEEEKARKERLLEEERKQKEEQERIRKEEEEKFRMAKERAEEDQRIEEERKLKEERKKLEEEEKIRKAQEEEEKRRIEREEKQQREEEKMRKAQEEEKRRIQREEKRQREEEEEKIRKSQEEAEKRKIEREEKRQREEEERVRKAREEQKRLEEEERRQRELKEEQERITKEEEKIRVEKERAEEELRRKREEEEYERLMEEKRKQEEEEWRQQMEEEKKRRQEEKEALEMERLAEKRRQDEEQKQRVEEEERVKMEEDRKASKTQDKTFDESDEHNPFEDVPESTARVTSARQRCKLPSERNTCSFGENDVSKTQQEKRHAPKPPRMASSERQQVAQHEVQVNKPSKDKEIKTASVVPQRALQKISPVSAPSSHINNSKQPEHIASTARTASSGRRAAPQRPGSKDEEGLSSTGYTTHGPVLKSKQAPAVHGLNPFEDDEDVDELTDQHTTTTTPGSVMWPPPVLQSDDKNAASQMKIKSLKTAHAPAPPAKQTHTSGTDKSHDTDVTMSEITVDKSSAPVQQPLHKESHCVQEEAVKKDAPPVPSRRLQPVRPLNPSDQQPVSAVQGERDNKSTGEIINNQGKTKVSDTGPYALLTQEELISLVLKQERQLSEKNKKISELEQYIDNLLVRVIEEAPSILMAMTLK